MGDCRRWLTNRPKNHEPQGIRVKGDYAYAVCSVCKAEISQHMRKGKINDNNWIIL